MSSSAYGACSASGAKLIDFVLANVEGYYEPLLLQIERSVAERFSPPAVASPLHVAPDAARVAAALEDAHT